MNTTSKLKRLFLAFAVLGAAAGAARAMPAAISSPIRTRAVIWNTSSLQSGSTFYVSSGTVSGQLAAGSLLVNGQTISAGSFIANQNTLQTGATFYVSSGTVSGQLAVGSLLVNGQSITSTGDIKPTAALTIPTGWLECDGSAVSRTTYASLFAAVYKSATVTITIASPGVVTWTSHGLRNNMPVTFSTTGALPTGLTAGTTYYVKNSATNTFEVAATPGGTSINTSGTQSGTHTGTCAPFGKGDGSTTFNLPNLNGRTLIGEGNYTDSTLGSTTRGLGDTMGEASHTLTTAEMPAHNHNIYVDNDMAGAAGGGPRVRPQASSLSNRADMSLNTGGGGSHNVMQPSLVVTWVIKT